jgi:fluoride ion exporter CrcB/FEX
LNWSLALREGPDDDAEAVYGRTDHRGFEGALNTTVTFQAESGRVLRGKDYLRFVLSGVLGVIATTTTLVLLSHLICR